MLQTDATEWASFLAPRCHH